jgi:autotransporter-associated beta strand protein
VPDTSFGDNAVVSTTTPNIATITADISSTPNDINVTGGGRIDHRAGTAGTSNGAWMYVGQDSMTSFYNLADTSATGLGISGYAQGSGTLNPTGNLQVASWGSDRNGTININTTGGVNIAGGLFIGNDNNCVGVINLESGAVIVLHGPGFATDNLQVGNNGGNGTLNISGGSLAASRNFRVGNEGGTGTINITGGLLAIGGTDDMFIGRDKGTAIFNQSGGVVDFNHNTFIANGNNQSDPTSGTYNLSAGVLNVKREFVIGREGVSATGTLNMTGGTITKTGDGWMLVGHNNAKGFVVQSGGTISANNELYIGNENSGAQGTYTLSGTGALNVAKETAVGRQGGTGLLSQSAGTITLSNNLYVGQSSGSTGTYNISGSSVLNVGRDFVIGREGGTGALNMTGGTITKTGDEKFLVGHNNGTGTVVQSGGTITANNELYIGNENSGAQGTYTLSGTGALNVANEVVVGRESGTGILNVDGGTMTTTGNGNMYIGRRNGTGTLNQTAGVISVIKEFGVGTRDDNKIGTGTYNLSGGSLSASNNIFIGKELGSSGTLNMTGGILGTSDRLQIGHNQSTGVVSQSGGTVNVQNDVYVGNENNASSVGTYTLSGTGVLNVGNEVIVGRDNGTGTLNLNGGTVNANKISGGTGSATVNFNGGVLKAKRDESNLIENLDVANVQSGGLKIDSNGFNVSTSQVLTGTGGLEKSGAGQLTLSGANTYAGTTTVAAGALRIEKTGLVAIVDATTNAIEAQFDPQPAPGDYPILPGSLAGTQTFSATGLGANQQATFDRSTSTVTVTETATGSTFASLYPAGSEATVGINGIKNLMNYALGGTGESSTPALPALTTGVDGLTLTANIRSDDTTLSVKGQYATDLSGPWTDVTLPEGTTSSVANTKIKSFTIAIDPAQPKKFLRFQVTK